MSSQSCLPEIHDLGECILLSLNFRECVLLPLGFGKCCDGMTHFIVEVLFDQYISSGRMLTYEVLSSHHNLSQK